MSFDNIGYARLHITDSIFITINDTIIGIWLIGAVLIALAIVVRVKLKKFKEVPETRFQNMMEAIVETFDNVVVGVTGPKYRYFGTWFFGVFMFFLLSNISGIVGLRPPTADLATTFAMGFSTVVLMQVCGFRHSKMEHVREFFRPVFIFFPLNVLSDLSRSISLSVRLFGNIFGGLIIIGLLYDMLPWFLTIGPPGVLSMYFDLFVGALHAFLFCLLSLSFIVMKAPEEY